MLHVLALPARAGHGKSTVANYLRDKYGAHVVSLATPLKQIARVVMDFSNEQLWGTQEQKEAIDPRYGFSPRIFLQKLGTEGLRNYLGSDVFLHALLNQIKTDHVLNPNTTVYVVDDVRFPNEAQFIYDLKNLTTMPRFFGTTIKLVCSDAPPSGNDNHPSERGVDEIPASYIDAVVISSRARGTAHLIEEVEGALSKPHLRNLRVALNEGGRLLNAARAKAARAA